jgi:phosphoenolpyruvate-protein kinase (PTS system EI component)
VVVGRALDLGGDKQLPSYLGVDGEKTTFMGLRAARLYFYNDIINNI